MAHLTLPAPQEHSTTTVQTSNPNNSPWHPRQEPRLWLLAWMYTYRKGMARSPQQIAKGLLFIIINHVEAICSLTVKH